ncbi:HK97-gp10 family putative phage morphogenesis protein [Bradyrhizobium cosmicum]|uniref:Phage protein HK97 gp10 family n=1 Tax=Bradyrhizobium cosmicum TaxID=1404864 RepID=A0AAI8MCQ0_9BRAD|nr:HK97-gp10 family putative phage morphogenesis protein [Bradyrhizobium cosmicum]BAL76007.1 phage protein HK97 gp10 family [Bradyrhizobium cosmicum]
MARRVNQSVARFRKLTEELKAEVHAEAVKELNAQADNLARLMVLAAPHDEGNLEHSVRKVPDRTKDTVVRVVAGGRLTTRPAVSSKPFDYARGDEFGTAKMTARPFFFPTYRLTKKKMISAMKRKLTKSIKNRSAE